MLRVIFPIKYSSLDYPENDFCLSIYFYGCNNNCKNCFNRNLLNYKYDKIDKLLLVNIINNMSKEYKTNNICFLGGDPFYKDNSKNTYNLINLLKDNYNICIYTGYNLTDLELYKLKGINYLKTGKYIEEEKQKSLKTDKEFILASKNQILYKFNEGGSYNIVSKKGIYKF